jgi:mRNA-degrading endonuclease toxin of MazEF toxin-antitoxin module
MPKECAINCDHMQTVDKSRIERIGEEGSEERLEDLENKK